MGLFNRKLMSDRQEKKLADARAMSDAAFAANPGAVNSLPGPNADPAELAAMVAKSQAEAQALQAIHRDGVEGPAAIQGMRPTGETDLGGGRKFEFDVSIQLASGESHTTQISQHMLPAQMEGLTASMAASRPITAKYDPGNPDNAVLIGW